MAIEIHRVILPKAQLATMPKDERVLVLLMGHATNEINVFSRFILMMRKDKPPTQVVSGNRWRLADVRMEGNRFSA
jgi:hypothetical protein